MFYYKHFYKQASNLVEDWSKDLDIESSKKDLLIKQIAMELTLLQDKCESEKN